MSSFKTLLSLSAIFGVSAQIAPALEYDTEMRFVTEQTFRQNPSGVAFRGGQVRVALRDGRFVDRAQVCRFNVFTSVPTGLCVPGTNAFIYPKIDPDTGDQIPDEFAATRHLVVDYLQPATAFEAARPNAIIQRTVPPYSTFRVPNEAFTDASDILFGTRPDSTAIAYGVEYRLPRYSYSKTYSASERSTFDSDIRYNANYEFDFPRIGSAITPSLPPLRIPVQIRPNADGYRKVNSQYVGFRFVNLPNFVNGYIEVNPRREFILRWAFAGGNPVLPAVDTLYFSLLTVSGLDPNANTTGTYFPAFGGTVGRSKLDHALMQAYSFPVGVFNVGATVVANLDFDRELASGGISIDQGRRSFQIPIRFVSTFSGDLQTLLPANTTPDLMEPDADYDGDGFTNFEEWAQGSDPGKASSTPANGTVVQTSGSGLSKSGIPGTGWMVEFNKVSFPEGKVTYQVEVSEDLSSWSVIGENNVHWEVINDPAATKLKVVSKSGEPPSGSFFRMKAILNQ